MQAGTVVMMANGKKKAPVIKKAWRRKYQYEFACKPNPHSLKGMLMTDKAAASELETSQHEG